MSINHARRFARAGVPERSVQCAVWVLLQIVALVTLSAWPVEAQTLPPGGRWTDTDGDFIDAHGGGILFHQGVYYWYGERKQGSTYTPEANRTWGGSRVLNGGFNCYSSKDLVHWNYEGLALASATNDPASDLHVEKVMERPKVIYNGKTKKFVMWFHQDTADYSAARSGVAAGDSPAGPFRYLGSFRLNAGVWPLNSTEEEKQSGKLAEDFKRGQMARDLTLFVDDDGSAYEFYASEGNATLQVSKLSDDYLKPSGVYGRILIGRSLEAPAVFKHEGKYFLIASGCSGWSPNAAHSAVATNIFGPWTELGNPCRGAGSDRTFRGQSTFVLRVPGENPGYIAMFDRWRPRNLADSRYMWLALAFENGRPWVDWADALKLPPGFSSTNSAANAKILESHSKID